jgi:hypothetical protein
MAKPDTSFKVRMSEELKNRTADAARASGRSMNAEIVARLQDSFKRDTVVRNSDCGQKDFDVPVSDLEAVANAAAEKAAGLVITNYDRFLEIFLIKPSADISSSGVNIAELARQRMSHIKDDRAGGIKNIYSLHREMINELEHIISVHKQTTTIGQAKVSPNKKPTARPRDVSADIIATDAEGQPQVVAQTKRHEANRQQGEGPTISPPSREQAKSKKPSRPAGRTKRL